MKSTSKKMSKTRQPIQRLLDERDQATTMVALERAIAAFDRGEGIPARQALDKLRKKYGLSR